MVVAINKAGSSPLLETTLRLTFDALWPQIDADIKVAVNILSVKPTTERSPHELLEEVLDLARRQDIANQIVFSRLEAIELRLDYPDQLSQASPGLTGSYAGLYGNLRPVKDTFPHLSHLSNSLGGVTLLSTQPTRSDLFRQDAQVEHVSEDDTKNDVTK
jgi:hypothetical protein